MTSKRELITLICSKLKDELEILTQAALAARDAATNGESKAEDQYDTRGLEASYLASAQAMRAADLKKTITQYENLEVRDFSKTDGVAATALVEVSSGQSRFHYFLTPVGAGCTVKSGDMLLQVVHVKSPVGEALLGSKVGDIVEIELQNKVREIKILSLL